uniref:DUF4276 family protein n=1 Tax=Geobacter sp. (strain M21) TaxID=443144 RepID=C6DZ01_GEOSM
MNESVEIVALVEGKTEQIFIQDLVSPYLSPKGIYIIPIQISKPGQKGGDVKFSRVQNDIGIHLKQRSDTYLTLFVDYYGINVDWPGLNKAKIEATPAGKAAQVNSATKDKVNSLFGYFDSERRFIPYVAMYEFEALLFSGPEHLAEQLQVPRRSIDKILEQCGEPERINDSQQTAPSKRLESLTSRFKKTSTGLAVAKAIGLPRIRERCLIFNEWLSEIERLKAGRL